MNGKRNGYLRELEAAEKAAAHAARLIRERAGNLRADAVREKAMNDLVTEVDEAAQQLIIRSLEQTFPGSSFLAEEGETFSSDETADGYLWIIDPIDGTTNFTRDVPPYAVSIALRDGGEIVVGVVLDVSRNDLFSAIRDRGLFVNGIRQAVSRTRSLGESLITTGFPYRVVEHVDVYLKVLGECMRRSRGVRRPGSASIDMAYVASGRFDGFFETGLKAWDVAAGTLLVEEGGGRVTDYSDRPNPFFRQQMLATNGLIHQEMLQVVAPMRDIRA